MFSTKEFIAASRKFVCVRIETYENKESEQLVRRVLNGKLENTAFVILDPQGNRNLTRSGRSPGMAMVRGRTKTDASGGQNDQIISEMKTIARQFKPNGSQAMAKVQDFNSLRQALNCASADQRLLVFVNVSQKDRPDAEKKLASVFADKDIIGKFHLNFINEKTDQGWSKVIQGAKNSPGIVVIRASQFGLDGQAVDQINLAANEAVVKKSLLTANARFAKVETRKDYEAHVRAGRRERVTFENEIESTDGKSGGGRSGPPGKSRPQGKSGMRKQRGR